MSPLTRVSALRVPIADGLALCVWTILALTWPDIARSEASAYNAALSESSTGSLALAPLTHERALVLGHRIWRNESNQSYELLTAWNEGEEFASLGIGHFIWYPAGVPRQFKETFPELLEFLAGTSAAHGPPVPAWLKGRDLRCPWPNRKAFLADIDSPRMRSLRDFLGKTIAGQSAFIARRLARALPQLVASTGEPGRSQIQARFEALYRTDAGLYALIDYVNFKGEGTSPNERYQGQGWGLLQVLTAMPEQSGHPANAFADAAAAVLRQRVARSPPERKEQGWLAGWMKRVDSYRVPP